MRPQRLKRPPPSLNTDSLNNPLPQSDPRLHVTADSESWTELQKSHSNELKLYRLVIDKILSSNAITLGDLSSTLNCDFGIPYETVLSFIRWISFTELLHIKWGENSYVRLPILYRD